MQVKRIFGFFFGSFWVAIPLLMVYATACALATFIENDYGTPASRAVVYNTWWFSALHVYLLLVIIGTLITSKAWQRKRYASLFFHSSLVFIILGAGVTRFFGFEATMHLRTNQTSDKITTTNSYLNLTLSKDQNPPLHFSLKSTLSPFSRYLPTQEVMAYGKPLRLEPMSVHKMTPEKRDNKALLEIKLSYGEASHTLHILGGQGIESQDEKTTLDGMHIALNWGVTQRTLPFKLHLTRFELTRYPGSMSPSSYASQVEVLDKKGQLVMPYKIFMNHVLDYGGYRFFQSSYDTDEQGTILSVNRDPGKNLTYLGYAMLMAGALFLLFSKQGRFQRLSRFLKTQHIVLFLCTLSLGALAHADEGKIDMHGGKSSPTPTPLDKMAKVHPSTAQIHAKILQRFKDLRAHAQGQLTPFARLQVQSFEGRIKPLDTLSMELIHKITKEDGFKGMDNLQVMLGMMLYPDDYKNIKMIYTSTPKLRALLGTPINQKRIAFLDVFGPHGYKLQNYVEEVNQKAPKDRDEFDKDVLKLDERINLVYMIFSGSILKIFPDASGNTWLSPADAIKNDNIKISTEATHFLKDLFKGFDLGVDSNQWEDVHKTLNALLAYQRAHSKIALSPGRVDSEILLNHSNFFHTLMLPYLLLGVVLLVVVLVAIFKNKPVPKFLHISFYSLLLLCGLAHSVGLALRWYVSGHAPWSNAYESMLYISWAALLAGLILRSNLALCASSFLAGIALFVAHLGFMDPQISNLVPVLKSYWLNIHVSIITASYGFLGLCFVLGLLTLLLFLLRNEKRPHIDSSILALSALNEMGMIMGLLLLAVGNFLGGVWANESWGRYWGWDPKETWALISIAVYAIILHLRFLRFEFMPYVFASASVIGFYSILMTYFGVNYYLSGMHSYAAGDPLPIPTFLYPLVASTFLLVFVAGLKRKLPMAKV
ncbi:Bifunctional cytochrome c biogenesis protein CcsA [Helicobacter ailurogastricus]|uniref:cytochrome c biogenesis protein n=1 Tax=Helicobacter ailurogastricus TaxID=1578720 RepID=UPI00244D9298|nr:cytochrome c biogenesis protein CcsA [Helicobacter ailurogastricus]GMB89721.1 Bifunctional cytochrome c biogenesis protein CcsA [Helicobacter ailurogastricus]